MAALGKTYTTGDVETPDYDNRGELPSGIFKMEMETSEIMETGPEGARTGVGLKYTSVVILPEELKGRKFFGFINLENQNSVAQNIGQEEFAAMRRAMEVDEVSDSEQLHMRPYYVTLGWGKVDTKRGQDARMVIKRYWFPDEGNIPVPAVDAIQKPQPKYTGEAKAASKPAAANNNQRPAGNDNKPAAAPADASKRPWGKK